MSQTICGIDVKAFADDPTPEELGSILAHWPSDKQAMFFLSFGEALRNCCGGREFMQWQHIADSIKETEERLLDGSGSQLIREIHSRLAADDEPGPHNFPDTYGCAGCTCRMSSVNSASIDPPEPILNQWCPVHGGRDVDAMNDARRDEGVF